MHTCFVCLLCTHFLLWATVRAEYSVTSSTKVSYLWMEFPSVSEEIFPRQLSVNLSITNYVGPLVYSIDANGNQLIVTMSGRDMNLLVEVVGGKELKINLRQLCGCKVCLYSPLLLEMGIGNSTFWTRCNKREMSMVSFNSTIRSFTKGYPTLKPKQKNASLSANSADLYFVNYPGGSEEQMRGCIFGIEYNGQPISDKLSIAGQVISKGCNRKCNSEKCNGGVCYETYTEESICDCSTTFGNGQYCTNGSRWINERYIRTFAKFVAIKLSWRSPDHILWQIGNKQSTLTLTLDFLERLVLTRKVMQKDSLETKILLTKYIQNESYVLILSSNETNSFVKMNNMTVIYANYDASKMKDDNYNDMNVSSCGGVMDVAVQPNEYELQWDQLTPRGIPSSPHICVVPARVVFDLFGWLVLLVPIVAVVVLIKTLFKRKRRGSGERYLPGVTYESVANNEENRREVEFHVFHLDSFSIVCSKDKISDFPSVLTTFKECVLPLDKPIFFCHFLIPPNCFPPSWTVEPLSPDHPQCCAYLVSKNKAKTIQKAANELPGLTVKCHQNQQVDDAATSAAILQIRPDDVSAEWINHYPVGFQQTIQGKPFHRITYALLRKSDKGEQIKNNFVDFLKCLHSVEIEMEFSEHENTSSAKCIELLKRVVVVRRPLMTFYDENNRELPDEWSPPMIETTDYLHISITRRSAPELRFYPPVNGENDQQTIRTFAGEGSVLAKGITDAFQTFVILRQNFETVGKIKEKIHSVLSSGSRLEIVSDEGIIADDRKVADVEDVVYYFFIEPFLPEKIMKGDCIKTGSYGKVYVCTIYGGTTRFALKEIYMEHKDDMRKDIISEILVTSRIDSHPRIVKYIGLYETPDSFYIRMDLMKQSLWDYIKWNNEKEIKLDEKKIKKFISQILDGLEYLHDNKIIHGDIKSANVLLDENDDAKLADFGLSKCLDITSTVDDKTAVNDFAGTLAYMAPEAFKRVSGGSYTYKCDIWSVGIIMGELITGKEPFCGIAMSQIFRILRKDDTGSLDYKEIFQVDYPKHFSSEMEQFLYLCLTVDPEKRPDCKTLRRHNFLLENKQVLIC